MGLSCLSASAAEGKEAEELIPPNPELQRLLNLRPYVKEEVARYNDLAVLTLVQKNPDAAAAKYVFRGRHNEGWQYPLKRAVSLGASLEVVRLMAEAHPDAIEERASAGLSGSGCTCLHSACVYDRPLEIVQFLAERHPPALKATTKHGYTPLHSACELGENAEVVRYLVQMYPGALHRKNKLNRTPAECAMSGGVDGEVKPDVLAALVYRPPPARPRIPLRTRILFAFWLCRRQRRNGKKVKRRTSGSMETLSRFTEAETEEEQAWREEAGFEIISAEIEAFLEKYDTEVEVRQTAAERGEAAAPVDNDLPDQGRGRRRGEASRKSVTFASANGASGPSTPGGESSHAGDKRSAPMSPSAFSVGETTSASAVDDLPPIVRRWLLNYLRPEEAEAVAIATATGKTLTNLLILSSSSHSWSPAEGGGEDFGPKEVHLRPFDSEHLESAFAR